MLGFPTEAQRANLDNLIGELLSGHDVKRISC